MLFTKHLLQQQASSNAKPISPHSRIYRVWGKPVSKMLLFSIGTYYTLYWAWEYLEKEELKRQSIIESTVN